MSRTGKFGRGPKSAPSLTSTVVGILREAQNQDDKNIMDAWNKGGLYHGAPVTDDMALAHWEKRLATLDKKDPLYDMYAKAVLQYQYSIAESKITVAYEQGKIGDQDVANFYLGWAEKVPKDSEFYRTLQRDAAQFVRGAQSKGAAAAKKADEEKYQAKQDAVDKDKVEPGRYGLYLLTMLAQHGSGGRGAVLGGTTVTGTDTIETTTNIGKLQLPSIDNIMALIRTVSVQTSSDLSPIGETINNPSFDGNPNVLFHDENGNPVTGMDIINRLRAADTSFDGNFNIAYVTSLVKAQKDGIKQKIATAKETGHISDIKEYQTELAKVTEYGSQISAWPVLQDYADLKDELNHVMKDNSLMPAAKLVAIDRIRGKIGKLADDPRIANDDHLRSQLTGEANGDEGTVTVGDDMQGAQTGYTNSQNEGGSEIADINAARAQAQHDVELTSDLASGHVMTQGDYLNGKFVPSPGGHSIGAALVTEVQNLKGGKPITVLVPNGDGNGVTPMMLVPAPVTAMAKGADGTPVTLDNKNPVAEFVKYWVNGVQVTLYGITDKATGVKRWTSDPPWDTTKVKSSETSGGIVLDLTAIVPTDPREDLLTGGDIGNGFSIVGRKPKTENGRVVPDKPGELRMDPAAATLATDPVRDRSGPDHNTDSFSATLLSLKQTPDGQELLRKYTENPLFRKVIIQDAAVAAGMTLDIDGHPVGTPAQKAEFAKYMGQYDITVASILNPAAKIGLGEPDYWQRSNTKTSLQGSGPLTRFDADGMPIPPTTPGVLPIDALRGVGDKKFGPLADAFINGTNQFKPDTAVIERLSIVAPLLLKVPANPYAVNPTGEDGRGIGAPVAPIAPPDVSITPKVDPLDFMSGGPTPPPAVEPGITSTPDAGSYTYNKSGGRLGF